MLLLSPSSSSPKLSIPGDNLFRLAPPDSAQGPIIAKMLKSYDIEAVILIQRGDEWADSIYTTFEPSFEALGGVIIHRIRYGQEDTEFSNYLEEAESYIQEAIAKYGKEHVAFQLICFAEALPMLLQAHEYPTMMNVTWFGTEGTVDFRMIADDAGEQASMVGLIGPVASPSYSVANLDLKEIGERFGFYQTWGYFHLATGYDCCWIYALSVLEASSPSALEVKAVLPEVAANYSGASGPCVLDENGDRLIVNFALRGYAETSPGVYGFHQYGFYNATTDTISWNELIERLPH
jgi:ABC-type branched-subunit amino acid transport system substrate-binding protein